MKLVKGYCFVFFLLSTSPLFAQVTPPGLDGTQATGWVAVAFNQELGKNLTLIAYGGMGRMSDPDSWALLHKPSIKIYNQEFQYKFSNRWQLSLVQSFRVQNLYAKKEPYEAEDPAHRYEIRYYARLYHKHNFGKTVATYSFRPEIRTFYTPSWEPASRPLELRFRLKGQLSVPLNANKTNFIIVANEVLTALTEHRVEAPSDRRHTWTPYRFTEDRLALYFRHVFTKADVTLNVGVMEQFRSGDFLKPVSHLAFDVSFQNPFSRHSD